ncbi:mechanosensitive ion channel domain-containing protein [Luteimonas sp. R10]|uniref:mechanosensitive ion channel domain-containing protein n=1 Tax=Luteimonas sp. R10 TaxID=3108176 RepID=UPI0030852D1E|nr:mechanosensitive ion channel family protein [Luteimonas sp. R10]
MPRRISSGLFRLCLALAIPLSAAQASPAQSGTAAGGTAPDPAQVEALRAADRTLQERLAARLAVIPGLEKTRVEVSGGVATLRGVAADDARRQLAATIVEQAQDVVLVDNQLAIDTDVRARTQPVFAHTLARLQQALAALPLLAIAVTIVLVAWWLGRWLSDRPRLLRRAQRNPFLSGLTRQAVRLAVLLAGLVIALDLLNATALVGALLGTAGIVGIAVGFAFRDVAENYIAGILLSLRQPFAPHDHVVVGGHEGKVAALTSRATTLITLDGNHLRLPNALVFKSVILNYSRNPNRSFAFDVKIPAEASISNAQRVALECLAGMPAVLREPAPTAQVAELVDTSVVLRIVAWVDQRNIQFDGARSEAIRLVKRAFSRGGVYAPAPEASTDAHGTEHAAGIDAGLGVEHHIERQIERERTDMPNDLLDPDAPRE